MSRRDPAALPFAVVRWRDASYQRGECQQHELEPLVELVTAGHVAREDGATISLAMDWCEQDRTWRHVQHIPKVNVLSVRRVRA